MQLQSCAHVTGRQPWSAAAVSRLKLSATGAMSWQIKMRVLKCLPAATTYPTGDKSFAVKQGFPDPISAEEADPFLMCDHFVRALNQLAPACAYSLSCVCPFTRPCMALRRPCRRALSVRMSSLCRGTPIEAWTSSPTSCNAKAATPTPSAIAPPSTAPECSGSGSRRLLLRCTDQAASNYSPAALAAA